LGLNFIDFVLLKVEKVSVTIDYIGFFMLLDQHSIEAFLDK